ncbi:MAG: hypothetical protein J7M08_00070 [Planctomycetes bacterium]|nr:hypothetical protein [Planctomycetota bacterium]
MGSHGKGRGSRPCIRHALGDWEAALAGGDPFPIVFLGLVLTLDCSFLPRCLYCNQIGLPRASFDAD